MKQLLTLGLIAAMAAPSLMAADDDANKLDSMGFVFTDSILVRTTPVKDQNKAGTCWCYSTTSFYEDENMRLGGDSLHLSEMYTVRKTYQDKADRYVRYYGVAQFAQGGGATDVGYVLKNYGAVPYEAYNGLNYGEKKDVHGEMSGILKGIVKTVVSRPDKRVSTAWKKAFDGVLDAYLGPEPETFTYKGKTYTPQSFAKTLKIKPEDYMTVTSFTHHPFYEPFIFEVSDNWLHESMMNVPMEEMQAIVDNALANGMPVAWGADVSEPGFKWKNGIAYIPKDIDTESLEGTELSRWVKLGDKERENEKFKKKGPQPEIEVTQEMRQDMFDRQETTDDHGMEIVGIAYDQEGNKWYKVKNSWDDNQIYGGYFYCSVPYFLAKTLNVTVHKDAVPKQIAKKFKK